MRGGQSRYLGEVIRLLLDREPVFWAIILDVKLNKKGSFE